jgi:ribA/ribD-fused uncharacterized protein
MSDAIEFNSKTELYSEFSNFHSAPIQMHDETWPTVEHYFQAQKFPTDTALQSVIRTAKSPAVARRLGKTKTPSFRADWNEIREEVMVCALRAKFSQHPVLRDLLVNTGSKELRELAVWDSYWGTGRTGKGKNRMGALLTKVRAELV